MITQLRKSQIGAPAPIALDVPGAKNGFLPHLYCGLVMDQTLKLRNAPHGLLDSKKTIQLLKSVGIEIEVEADVVTVEPTVRDLRRMDRELVRQTRYSALILGASLARCEEVVLPAPGGCNLNRALDIHVAGFRALGARVIEGDGCIKLGPGSRTSGRFELRQPSVGATLNLTLAGVLGNDEVELANVAIEPEIVDFVDLLRHAGARIEWIGDRKLLISGVSSLSGADWSVIPDRIAAITYVVAAAMNESGILLNGVEVAHLAAPLSALAGIGLDIEVSGNTLRMRPTSLRKLRPFTVEACPYPGFPTDLQPIMTALAACIGGESRVLESVFDTRFQYVAHLNRIGSDIVVCDRSAVIKGRHPVRAATHDIACTDIRGGMSAVLFAIAGGGDVNVHRFHEIERGYLQPEALFAGLGYTLEQSNERG